MVDKLKTAIKVLKQTRSIVDLGWYKGATARDAYNVRVEATDPAACKWCLTGALEKAMFDFDLHKLDNDEPYPTVSKAWDSIYSRCMGQLFKTVNAAEFITVTGFNDHPEITQVDVLTALDTTIRRMERDVQAKTGQNKTA